MWATGPPRRSASADTGASVKRIDRLENNFETGDSVVDVIGFSRGAALAVSFANELAGKLPRVIIRFMGLWDMVGQFGAPGRRFNAGHDLGMPPNVMRCYHAMALDETRLAFPLTRLSETDPDNGRLLEVWFRGLHTDIGGGNGNRGINWISLNWLFENARRDGLPDQQNGDPRQRRRRQTSSADQ